MLRPQCILFIFFSHCTVLFSYSPYAFCSIDSLVLTFESLPFRGQATSRILHIYSLAYSNICCLSCSLTHIGKCVKSCVHNDKIIVGFSLIPPPLQKTFGCLIKKLTRAQTQSTSTRPYLGSLNSFLTKDGICCFSFEYGWS